MHKFGIAQPDPITELTKRLEALEARVFGNTEQAQPAPEPKPETVYDGVFWFSDSGIACCVNGEQVMWLATKAKVYQIASSEDWPPTPHRLVPVDKFTVGKWYARGNEDLNTPFGYSMYLGDYSFIAWDENTSYPIWIHAHSENGGVLLLEVQPA